MADVWEIRDTDTVMEDGAFAARMLRDQLRARVEAERVQPLREALEECVKLMSEIPGGTLGLFRELDHMKAVRRARRVLADMETTDG